LTEDDVAGIRRAIMAIADQPTPTDAVLAVRCNSSALQALRDLLIRKGLFDLDEWEAALRPVLERELADGAIKLSDMLHGYNQPIVSTPRLGAVDRP